MYTVLGKSRWVPNDDCCSMFKLSYLKAYRLSELNFFVYIKSCQYSMFYANKMF